MVKYLFKLLKKKTVNLNLNPLTLLKEIVNPKPGCPNCGSTDWQIQDIALGAYVPFAHCNTCKHNGNVEIGSKYDKKEYGGMF